MQQIIEQTVSGLGYELVDVERTSAGTLRITIDFPWHGAEVKRAEQLEIEQYVTTEDCEKVSNQLQYVLEVEGVDYKRLEISSPGLDRELKTEKDYWRFQNYQVELTLNQPIAVMANAVVAGNRKKFTGILLRADQGWQLLWQAEENNAKAKKLVKKNVKAKTKDEQIVNVLDFDFADIREARLVPVISFKKS